MKRLVTTVSLFTSMSTLICCALPVLLVTLGLGAVLAGAVTVFPQLVWVSDHKSIVFGFSGVMLLLSGFLQWQARRLSCPTDPALRKACGQTRHWSLVVYLVSLGIYLTGSFFAFIAPSIF